MIDSPQTRATEAELNKRTNRENECNGLEDGDVDPTVSRVYSKHYLTFTWQCLKEGKVLIHLLLDVHPGTAGMAG